MAQLRLHAAIAAVLIDAGARQNKRVWLTYPEVAQRIADADLYRRGKDGAHPPPNQIAGRVSKYLDVFERRESSPVVIALRPFAS